MIEWISTWAEAIIIAVIIATIIEMILPEGSSKKYIKVVVGIYILFTIVSPVIAKFTGKTLAVSEIIELDEYVNEIKEKKINENLEQENSASIREIYIGNLKTDISSKIKGKNYIVNEIQLDVADDDTYTLNKIILSLEKKKEKESENIHENDVNNIEIVQYININIVQSNNIETNNSKNTEKKEEISNSEKSNLKEYLSSVYEINKEDIVIN